MPPRRRLFFLLALLGLGGPGLAPAVSARDYFVDATAGRDENDGTTPAAPWRTLAKVNAAPLQPGDAVRFKRGAVWRGQLTPQSGREGAPVTYGAYGEGSKPLILGSVSRNAPADWRQEGGNIWATAPRHFSPAEPPQPLSLSGWGVHRENGARITRTTRSDASAPPEFQITCVAPGTAPNHLQVFNSGVTTWAGDYAEFVFRARSTQPFMLPAVRLTQARAPYATYGTAPEEKLKIGTEWMEFRVRFRGLISATDGRITLMLGGALPAGAEFSFQPLSWQRWRGNDADTLPVDVGNIIFDHGKAVGVKRWKPEELQRPGDYWYSAATGQVKLHAVRNPAETFASIEFALHRHIINQGGRSHVTYEHLAVMYGAAHGFGGGSTHHLIIRQCDVAWIGGGHQLTTPDGRPVRFGNGIEFWSEAHDNLVEGCRLWEIYDAALTNQGGNNNTQADITYRHNVIWNSEYSFEYWNGKKSAPDSPQLSSTRNIRFEYNTCVNAGAGWGHTQRPDPNGRHLMFYLSPVPTSEFFVRNNIFAEATNSGARFLNDWTAALTQDHNCWYQPAGHLIQFLKTRWSPAQFAEYQRQTGLDVHSRIADPGFFDAPRRDFRLRPGSPALTLSTTGGPVGAQQRLVD